MRNTIWTDIRPYKSDYGHFWYPKQENTTKKFKGISVMGLWDTKHNLIQNTAK